MSTYKPSQWNAICDICGFEFKSEKLYTDWRGLKVCKKDYEQRHPQDLLKTPLENSSVPWTRSENTSLISPVCDIFGSSSIPKYGIPGCLIPSKVPPFKGQFI